MPTVPPLEGSALLAPPPGTSSPTLEPVPPRGFSVTGGRGLGGVCAGGALLWRSASGSFAGAWAAAGVAKLSEADAERAALDFLSQHVPANNSPMCGNSICQDRRFLARWMPRLEAHFHYRNLDVSTLKELVRRWKPELAKGFAKEGRHEAMADILESIEELKFYRKSVMTI